MQSHSAIVPDAGLDQLDATDLSCSKLSCDRFATIRARMRFEPGAPLGPDEFVAPIGAGGMGEIYIRR
jgi:hypothetical protein